MVKRFDFRTFPPNVCSISLYVLLEQRCVGHCDVIAMQLYWHCFDNTVISTTIAYINMFLSIE